MKEKIKELILHHSNSRDECRSLLEELNQIDNSKLSLQEINELGSLISKYQEEYAWRGVFIFQLEDLL